MDGAIFGAVAGLVVVVLSIGCVVIDIRDKVDRIHSEMERQRRARSKLDKA